MSDIDKHDSKGNLVADAAQQAMQAKSADESETKLDMVLDAIPHPLLICDASMHILDVNDAAQIFFHSSHPLLTSQGLEKVLAFGSPILELFRQVSERQTPSFAYDVKIEDPFQIRAEENVDVYISPLAETRDRLIVMLQKRNLVEQIERQLDFRNAGQSVMGIAEVLAHEIRNPLSGIKGAAQLLEQTVGREDQALAQLIREETDRIASLIDQIDMFGDARAGQFEAVNIHTILNHVKNLAQNGFAKNIDFEEVYDPSLPPVKGEKDQLIQIFLNLVKNAAEALEGIQNPKIIFKTSFQLGAKLTSLSSKSGVVLPISVTIMDNGPGIPDGICDTLFEPFVSSKSNTMSKSGGARQGKGLGLALVSKYIAAHEGFIDCQSTPGKTEFQVLLPIFDEKLQGANKLLGANETEEPYRRDTENDKEPLNG